MKSIVKFVTCAMLALSLVSSLQAASISVNFSLNGNDNNAVDADETAVTGIPGAKTISGSVWNNLLTDPGVANSPANAFAAATQGGNSLSLIDDNGNTAASVTSAGGTFFTHFADNTDSAARGTVGDAGMMQSDLLLSTVESFTVSGLGGDFARYGYTLYVFHGGDLTRSYGVRVDDGIVTQDFYTADNANPDSDANDDGFMEWVQATGTTLGTATTDANYSVYTGLTGASFTVTGLAGSGGRSSITGFQVVSGPFVPEPATASLLGLGVLGVLRRRRVSWPES